MSKRYYIMKKKDYEEQLEMESKLYSVMKDYLSHNSIMTELKLLRSRLMLDKCFECACSCFGYKSEWYPNEYFTNSTDLMMLRAEEFIILENEYDALTIKEMEVRLSKHDVMELNTKIKQFCVVDGYNRYWVNCP